MSSGYDHYEDYGYEDDGGLFWDWDNYDPESLHLEFAYQDHLDYLAGLANPENLVDCE